MASDSPPSVGSFGVPGFRFSPLSVRAGAKYVAPAGIVSAALLARRNLAVGLPLLAITGLVAATFRHTPRLPVSDPDLLFAVAYGEILSIEPLPDGSTVVRTYLRLYDPHEVWAPTFMDISAITVTGSRRLSAFKPEAAGQNYQVRVETLQGFDVTLFAGLIARAITMDVQTGESVRPGRVLGTIHLGSGTLLRMPPGWRVIVEVGDRVRGGESVIAVRE